MMQRLSALLLLTVMLVIPTIILAQGILPAGAQEIFGALVGWPRTKVEYVFLAAAWLGVFAHWWNKHRLGEITGNFASYLMADAATSPSAQPPSCSSTPRSWA
jgi:hypothetical protein